jgi:broad specificity phosphatase PhoE
MNDSTVINTVSHGETLYDTERRYAGTIDVPLSPKGVEDTVAASRKMAVASFDIIITSALKRAIQTAEYFSSGATGKDQCELCNERNFGKMQGLTEEEARYIQPKIEHVYAGYNRHPLNPPCGESIEMLMERTWEFLRYILGNYRGLNVLVVSHPAFLQQFHGVLRGEDWLHALEKDVLNLELKTFHVEDNCLLRGKKVVLPERSGFIGVPGARRS